MCFISFQHGSAIQQSGKWGWKKRNEPQLQDLWKAPLLVDCLHCHISSWSFWKCSLFDIVSRRIRSSTDYLQWRVEFILVDRSWPGDAATKSYGKYGVIKVNASEPHFGAHLLLYMLWHADCRAPLVQRSKRTSSMTSSLVASLALSTQFVVLETTMGSYKSKIENWFSCLQLSIMSYCQCQSIKVNVNGNVNVCCLCKFLCMCLCLRGGHGMSPHYSDQCRKSSV